jgi:putative ABC transport system permease protein
MSYAVTQRTHEIGIRMALGAQMGNVIKLIMKSGLLIAIIGVAIGLGRRVCLDAPHDQSFVRGRSN